MEHKILMTGEKQTFLTRVLTNKLNESGHDCEFVVWDVDGINSKWDESTVVVMYIDENERPDDKFLHYLSDKMTETGDMMILIGAKDDIDIVKTKFPVELIYTTYTRPVNNDEFMKSVDSLFKKLDTGEFKKSILVVDDDPNYLALVREWLKDCYKVSMANSGMQAIKWLAKNKVDLILLDYEMPVTSGPQVLEMLKSESETKDIPVMFLTGKSDKESVMKVVALKPEGYFLKTIKKKELLKILNNFFIKIKA
ncbi:MAG: response regulator [Lachnospiraceae bacterium]|nr:response regulator [Lachnospiraceae bacterium]